MQPEKIVKRKIAVGIQALLIATGFFKGVGRGWPSPTIIQDAINLPMAFVVIADDALNGQQYTGDTPGTFIAEHRWKIGVLVVIQKPDYANTLVAMAALDDQILVGEAVVKKALNEKQPGNIAQLARWYATKTPTEWAAIQQGSCMPCFFVDFSENVTDPESAT